MTEATPFDALEHYLAGAPVEHVRPLTRGAGHPRKMTLVLRGGVGVVAKAGDSDQMLRQARREVAAWVLATELDMARLVPATVMREIPAAEDESAAAVEGSVQVLWPRFRMALEESITPGACSADVSWPIAILDLLMANTDRKEDNWGTIDGLPRAVLIDHGHAFEAADSHSLFVDLHREEAVPPDWLAKIASFAAQKGVSRLRKLLDGNEYEAVFGRAEAILKHKTLTVE